MGAIRLLAVGLICVFFGSLSASSPSDKPKLAAELSTVLGTEEMFAAYLHACTASNVGYDPKDEFRANPAYFGGISPQSSYWPEIEMVYQNYQRQVCGYLTAADFRKFYADHFVSALSAEEMRSAIRFYSSVAGKKLRTANLSANEAFQMDAQTKLGAQYKKSVFEGRVEVAKIIQRYKKNSQ